jgi:hypothetical protein
MVSNDRIVRGYAEEGLISQILMGEESGAMRAWLSRKCIQ